jgi:hypothetical protein
MVVTGPGSNITVVHCNDMDKAVAHPQPLQPAQADVHAAGTAALQAYCAALTLSLHVIAIL